MYIYVVYSGSICIPEAYAYWKHTCTIAYVRVLYLVVDANRTNT